MILEALGTPPPVEFTSWGMTKHHSIIQTICDSLLYLGRETVRERIAELLIIRGEAEAIPAWLSLADQYLDEVLARTA
jgi:HEAT repeat protein